MNLFNNSAFNRAREFVRGVEAGLRETKIRAAYNPLPVRWQWYVVTDAGPDSEKDYTDERYWLIRAELTNSDDDTASNITESEIPDTDDRFRHITATNMAEFPFGSHNVEVGTLVQVRVAYGAQSVETPRFFFTHGEGTDLLYLLGGYFNAAGSLHAPSLAIAKGTRWYRFNYEEYPWFASQTEVKGMVVWNGDLYAIGEFKVDISPNTTPPESAGHFDSTATKFAKWDDAAEEWVEVASSSTALGLATVNCIGVYGGNIIIGGTGATTGVRVFNGSGFSDLGSSGDYLSEVYAFLEWDGDLYAAGTTGGAASGLAVLSGTAWAQVEGGTNGSVFALAVHDDGTGEALYFGGGFTQADSVNRRNIARYNGTAVQSVYQRNASFAGFETGTSDSVRSLASFGGKLWIGGRGMNPGGTLATWDGQRLNAAPFTLIHHTVGGLAPPATVNALRVVTEGSESYLLAGGEFYYVQQGTTGAEIPFSARYDSFEGHWTRVSDDDLNDSIYEKVVYDSDVYAVGKFTKSGTADCGYFAKLASGTWAQAGQVNGECYCAAAFNDGSADILLVGGSFSEINGGDSAGNIFRLNGTTLDAPFTTDGPVRKIKGDYLCGAFTDVNGTATKGIAKVTWSGGTPTVTLLVDTLTGGSAEINDFCTDGTYLYATGSFTTIGNSGVAMPVSASNVARMLLSTGEWSAMSTGFTSAGYAAEMHNGAPIFSSNVTPFIRRWTGSSFGLLLDTGSDAGPTQSTAPTRAPQMLKDIGGTLYVDYQGGTNNRNRLCRLPAGGVWEAVGGGNPADDTFGIFDRPIRSAVSFDSGSGTQIHVGGDFTQVGNDSGQQVLPRCCMAKIHRNGYTTAFLGGIGSKVNTVFSSGESNYVLSIDVLTDAPGLTGQSIGVGGLFEMANRVQANGVAGYSTRRGFIQLGVGLRFRSATAGKALVGARDLILGSDGWHYFAGAFDEGVNAQEGAAHPPEGVSSQGVIAHDGTEYVGIAPVAAEAVSNIGETQTDDEDATDTTFVATQFTTGSGAQRMTGATVRLQNTGGAAVRVGLLLYSDVAGAPNTLLHSLTGTTEVAAGATANVSLAADYELSGSTSYWLALKTESGTVKWLATTSNSETSGLGWTIGDDNAKASTDSGSTWSSGLGYSGLMTILARDESNPIGEGYCLAEYGTDGNGDPQIILGHTEGIHLWDWENESWTDLFTNLDTSVVNPPLFSRIGKLGANWYVCGEFQVSVTTDARFARFDGVDEFTPISLPSGVDQVRDFVIGDIGAGTKMYLVCSVSASENCVYSYDGSTFTVIGPTGTGAGAVYGNGSGIAIVDFGGGPTLAITGGEIQSVGQQMCVYDVGGNTWSGTGTYPTLGLLDGAQAVHGGTKLILSGQRVAGLVSDNPDVGVVMIDCMAEYDPTNGWRRVNGLHGCNEYVAIAGD